MSSSEVHTPIAASQLREVRKQQARRFAVRAFVVVGLPTLLVAAYLGVVASRQYESNFTVAVDAANSASLLGPTPGVGIPRDTMMAQECFRSRDVFHDLVEHANLRRHYQSSSIDPVSRLGHSTPDERAFFYFRKHTSVTYDPDTSFLLVHVRAFSGSAAHRFAERMLRFCDGRMRGASVEARRARVHAAEAEAEAASRRLASAATEVRAAEGDAARLELANARKEVAIRSHLAALDRVEAARVEASRDDRYLIRVTEPSRPDSSSHPEVFRMVLAVFLATSALFVIGSILFSAAREHADV